MSSITVAGIADIRTPSSVKLSPDGKRVVYVLRPSTIVKKHYQTSLWVADVGKKHSARQITSGNFYDEEPQFAPDGTSIAFLSDREHPGKLTTLYHMPFDQPGEARCLTSTENQKSIGFFQWSPDGKCIAYLSADEKPKDVKEKEEAGNDAIIFGFDLERARLRMVDTHSRSTKTLVSADGHVGACCWSPAGDKLVYSLCKGSELDHTRTAADIYVIRMDDGKSHKICHMVAGLRNLLWANECLLWISPQDGCSKWTSLALWSTDISAESTPARMAYGEDDCAMGLQLCGKDALIHVQSGLFDRIEQASDQGLIVQLETDLLQGGWDVVSGGSQPVVAYMKGSVSGGEVVSRIGGVSVQLSQHENKDMIALIKSCETLSCQAEDGLPIDGVLYQSSLHDPKDGIPAAVVIPHGGPYFRSAPGMDPCWNWTPWLLAQGYTVLHPNYRGGSGHGAKFAETVQYNSAASYQDVITLTRKCIAEGKMDPKWTAIAGWSQGGYLAYLATTRSATFHFAAAVAGAGVSCWDTMTMTSDVPIIESGLGGNLPWVISPENVTGRRSSPIWHMQDIRTPLLIVHGEKDARVPVSQARSFALGMRELGKPCTMITYPREGHGGMPHKWERAHSIHMLEAVKDFLAMHLK